MILVNADSQYFINYSWDTYYFCMTIFVAVITWIATIK